MVGGWPGHAISFGWNGSQLGTFVDGAYIGATAIGDFLPLAGGAITGNLLIGPVTADGTSRLQVGGQLAASTVVAGGNTVAATVNIAINAAAGQSRVLRYQSAGVSRWIMMCDGSGEVGSNAGSDFVITRYNDAGSALGNAVSIARSTGITTLGQGLVFSGGAASAANDLTKQIQFSANTGLSLTTNRLNIVTAASNAMFFVVGSTDTGYINASGLNAMIIGAQNAQPGTFTNLNALSGVTVGQTTSSGPINVTLQAVAGQARYVRFQTAGVNRWHVGAYSNAESAGSGSDFTIGRYNDAGTQLDSPLAISRNSGAVLLTNGIGIFGTAAPTVKPTLTGSRGGNAALAALITMLATTFGFCTDSTTA